MKKRKWRALFQNEKDINVTLRGEIGRLMARCAGPSRAATIWRAVAEGKIQRTHLSQQDQVELETVPSLTEGL